jgi:hypothetical protein
MKYVTWKLYFEVPTHGIGPELKVQELGGKMLSDAGWMNGEPGEGGTLLGYLEGDIDAAGLSDWDFKYLTKEEALEFCLALSPLAYFHEDGRIIAPIELDTLT